MSTYSIKLDKERIIKEEKKEAIETGKIWQKFFEKGGITVKASTKYEKERLKNGYYHQEANEIE